MTKKANEDLNKEESAEEQNIADNLKVEEAEVEDFNREEYREELADFLPHLKKPFEELTSLELKQLREIKELEEAAKEYSGEYSSLLTSYFVKGFKTLQANLTTLKLSKEDLDIVDNIYKQTILIAVTKASEKLIEPLSKGKGVVYNKLLSEQTVNILNSIINFKKSIDERFPGLSDKIIAAAAPALTALAMTYAPPVALVFKTTGILEKATNILTVENMEKIAGKMQSDLDKIAKTKGLAEAQELGTKLSVLEKLTEIPVKSLKKSGMTLKNIEEVTLEVAKNPEAIEFLTEVCKYIEKHVPDSEKEIDELFEKIEQDAITKLEENGASKELIEDFKKEFKEESISAKLNLEDVSKQEMPAFDKIDKLQKGADLMEKAQKNITKTLSKEHPSEKTAITDAAQSVDANIKTKVRGDLKGVASKMTSTTKAKDLAKKHLGAGFASEITIKRSLKTKGQIQAR